MADDGNHRHTEFALQSIGRHVHATALRDVHHVQRHDHRPAEFDELADEIQIALKIARIDNDDDHVRRVRVATKPAQLAPTTAPAVTVTVSFVVPEPPVQYMVKDHTPALTVCEGRFVNPKMDVVPLAETEHAVARVPTTWSIVDGVQPGETPVPCR